MKSDKAFTLVELLVVVLIIGILAAIAVPQYQFAVDKSRYVKLVTYVNAIEKAEKVFYEANGYYTPDFNSLDIKLPNFKTAASSSNGAYYISDQDGKVYCVLAERGDTTASEYMKCYDYNMPGYPYFAKFPNYYPNKNICISTNEIADKFCAKMTGTTKDKTIQWGSSYLWFFKDNSSIL